MNVGDQLQQALGAALIRAGLNFQTITGPTKGGDYSRTFAIPYVLPEELGLYTISAYVGGIAIVALAPFRIISDSPATKRHEIADFLIPRIPFVRVAQDMRNSEDSAHVAWVESAVPVPTDGVPFHPDVAIAPVHAVASAMLALRTEFRESTSTIETLDDVPIMISTGSQETMGGAAHAVATR